MEILGRNSVTIVDGSGMYSNIFEVKGHDGITLSGAVLHILTAGRRFNMRERKLIDR
jgi:cyanophycinase-like exopeptidase